ncbi:hypothetical protein IW261DRAFT_1419881 [Armillaria novae-zelandiae]|uniref:Heterokaryon incompatibility domain-containing protein n=1 Tax=Armillaria novae-zelandiae TaxID=153914 RepID=A0AA39P886_9AGAR|nr:hypothetical protein IW261DRAFT_1419881 [Armillaria novae-zelandiae]
MSINNMLESLFNGVGASQPYFPLTTTTTQVYIAGSSQRQLSTALRRQWIPTLAHEEFTGYLAPFKAWCGRKKVMVSRSWWQKKKSASRWFEHSRVSLWYDKGITSVLNNAPELNKVVRRCPPIYHEPRNLPDITLTALTETGRAESTIPVPKQCYYTGRRPVISSALADTRCADLGVDGVLKRLNATLCTSYSLGSKVLSLWRKPTLRSILKPYVERNDDFGTVYSHLRHFWYRYDVAAIEDALRTGEEKDRQWRKEVLVDGRITTSNMPTRRMWDLYANRVAPPWVRPSWVVYGPWEEWSMTRVCGISHAWVDENDRVDVITPINGGEWPVPMPKDANLDLIRIEMLNHGVELAWLDVLCLRQHGGKGEHLRLEEWKLDVPTIGWVYSYRTRVVCYFNGLGWPLRLTPGYFESDRCWFQRAWTLQEISFNPIIGGETGDDVAEDEESVLEHASEMRNRVSSGPLDKVAGLAYLFNLRSIPMYDAKTSDAVAWEVLMDLIFPPSRAELFFCFPEPGNGRKYWRPSWQQILTMKHCLTSPIWWGGCVEHGDTDQNLYKGYFIDSADVRGLDEGLEQEKPRQGEMVFKTFDDHVYPIPDGSYAVAGPDITGCGVVGWLRENQKFEKLCSAMRKEKKTQTASPHAVLE